jgi:hypothetical protein
MALSFDDVEQPLRTTRLPTRDTTEVLAEYPRSTREKEIAVLVPTRRSDPHDDLFANWEGDELDCVERLPQP